MCFSASVRLAKKIACTYNVLHDQAEPVVLPSLPAVISGQQSDHGGAVSDLGHVLIMLMTYTSSSAHNISIQPHIPVEVVCSRVCRWR